VIVKGSWQISLMVKVYEFELCHSDELLSFMQVGQSGVIKNGKLIDYKLLRFESHRDQCGKTFLD